MEDKLRRINRKIEEIVINNFEDKKSKIQSEITKLKEENAKLKLKVNELIELRQAYKQLQKRYDNMSNELLMYYVKYGKEGIKCKKQ